MAAAPRRHQSPLTGRVIWPGDPAYEAARQPFNTRFARFPAGIVVCSSAEDVQNAVRWARQQGIPAEMHTIEGALAKIERVLPTALRLRLQAVQAAVTFVSKPAVAQPPGEMVLLLSTAVQQQRRVTMRYQTRGEETVRSVDPYGMALHWNN